MHKGKIGNWLAIRMGNDLHEMEKGTIPNQERYGKGRSFLFCLHIPHFEWFDPSWPTEQRNWPTLSDCSDPVQRGRRRGREQSSGNYEVSEGIKRTTRTGVAVTTCCSSPFREITRPMRESCSGKVRSSFSTSYFLVRNSELTQQVLTLFKCLFCAANFKRPVVILGPLNDIAMEKLSRELPDDYEVAGNLLILSFVQFYFIFRKVETVFGLCELFSLIWTCIHWSFSLLQRWFLVVDQVVALQ